jgi:hypothetical protein
MAGVKSQIPQKCVRAPGNALKQKSAARPEFSPAECEWHDRPVTFPAEGRCGRLLFGISEDGKRPTLWYFDPAAVSGQPLRAEVGCRARFPEA